MLSGSALRPLVGGALQEGGRRRLFLVKQTFLYNQEFRGKSYVRVCAEPQVLKRVLILALALAGLVAATSCGGGSSGPPSGLSHRAFISVALNSSLSGEIDILDAAHDAFFNLDINTGATQDIIPLGQGAGLMALTPDKTSTLVLEASGPTISIISNAAETAANSISIPSTTESMIVGNDNKTVYVAMRNALVSNAPTGLLDFLDLSSNAITGSLAIAEVRRLVLSHNGNKLLAFSDDSNSLNVVDTASKTATPVAGFDRPTWGVFSSDDSKAYILSCGPECGGTAAKLTVLDMTSLIPGASIPVSAATIALLNGSTLYVAGTAGGNGKLDVVDIGSFAVTKSGIPISDGNHDLMALGSNNQLYIGAKACAGTTSCLSTFNTSSQASNVLPVVCSNASTANPCKGDVTALQPISGRSVTYVIEGGELIIFDDTTGQPQTGQVDIVGQAVDVKQID